uniref:F-box domain-containing protein n=1 Tax=Heterorhabditis bacteriophora TaxID=37862 RepID=A0A1I7XGE5_HETBA
MKHALIFHMVSPYTTRVDISIIAAVLILMQPNIPYPTGEKQNIINYFDKLTDECEKLILSDESPLSENEKDVNEEQDVHLSTKHLTRWDVQEIEDHILKWFPNEKRAELIPWSVENKIKDIRLTFFDNRIGHGERDTFEVGDFLTITGQMMFAYGDSSEPLTCTKIFMLDIIHNQMNMLLRRMWTRQVHENERRVITYTSMFKLFRNNQIRLRRLIRYIMEQQRIRHPLFHLDLDKRKRYHEFTDIRVAGDDIMPGGERFLRNMCPHIYIALKNIYGNVTPLCDERRIKDCDPDLTKIKRKIKQRNIGLCPKDRELWEFARRVSFCSRSGRQSAFRAHRFHEFLGIPELQTDVIFIFDFLVRELVMEMVSAASFARDAELSNYFSNYGSEHCLQIRHFEEALRVNKGWRKCDILFGEPDASVPHHYALNAYKTESDNAYLRRTEWEFCNFRKEPIYPPWPQTTTCKIMYEEHQRVVRGEYWDIYPHDLSKYQLAQKYQVI